MVTYTIFKSPKDYPGKYVRRMQLIVAGGIILNGSVKVSSDYDEVTKDIRNNCIRIWPCETDDPSVVETWM